jgi:hypothetical protein
MFRCLFQPGEPRTAAKTLQTLEEQVEAACWPGGATTVEGLQQDTGTSDVVAQQWIDRAIEEVKRVRQEDPNLDPEDIADKVRDWLFSQPGEKFNPLLTFPGMLPLVHVLICESNVAQSSRHYAAYSN